ncbi:hypothetical protein EMIHUDRAFT_456156 [Emiliania huxleyi CCMP1516]|uniref:Uncharacterized protein n=2 Tax=Emiliania huxleyi TaxID=2903 RepID=A0A0D3K848_EMIH1|nr:hypothetical protein EMIHUDRAFT_456156 [Emiliania huxleyi CCMP1516]EOD31933.1 hypothetical protein EMIHUDRAFT_456156 [Emiliania huxleyi CCMP1516]|eukprot:XP_005784362.1 hypothetical protein EMIHUDRAFT_456156 [Emiliania huxleyi CCMP1516]
MPHPGKKGKWGDRACSGGQYACLCAGPSTVSDNFKQDLVKLEADLEARLHEIRAAVSKLYAVATVIALLPTLLMVGLTLLQLAINQRTRTALVGVARNTQELASARMARWLLQARRSAVRRRLQVSGAMGQIGWALVVYGILPVAMSISAATPIDKIVGEEDFWRIPVVVGFFFGLLALFPTDERAIRTICTVFLTFYLGLAYLYAHGCIEISTPSVSHRSQCQRFFLPKIVVHLSASAALVATLPWLLSVRSAWAGDIIFGAVSLAIAALATPANRGRVTRWLGRLGSRGSEAEEAAAIAMLLGRANPERALAAAEALFRCLPASQLTADDLADSGATGSRRASRPASMSAVTAFDIAAKSIPARLGEVTAFLSHSWKDEEEVPGAKYTAIAQWAHCQRRKSGHEPTLWLAKPPELVEAYATGKADYYGLYRRKFAGEDVNL